VAAIDEGLHAAGNPMRAVSEKRYLKSDLEFLGVGVPAMRAVAKAMRKQHPGLDHQSLIDVVASLWAMPVYERRGVAIELLDLYHRLLLPEDVLLIERLLRESRTWALVDPLAIDCMGVLVQRYPEITASLDRWSTDADFWIRRSAMLALLLPLRKGDGDFKRFGRYADAMLEEKEFFIRKAIGWVLREAGRAQPDTCYGWLMPHAHRASGVTVREAVKYLRPDQREAVLAAYRLRTRPFDEIVLASADSATVSGVELVKEQ